MSHPTVVTSAADAVASHALACLPGTLDRLCGYLRIPAISCDPARHEDVARLCERVRADLTELGFAANVHRLERALPLVAAEYRVDPKLPTVLIYGHLDLQPVKGENWTHPPHEPIVREGRLYARGAADDMGGWVSHLAALDAYLKITSSLPVNVKLVIEGEEEIGSPNLERYMDAFPDAFAADVMVLTDCENPSTDIPGLTVSLRGIYEVELVCEAISSDIHSGLWGNMVPDPGNALILALARLLDENGRFKLARRELSIAEQERLSRVPITDEVVREGGHLLPDVNPLPLDGRSAAEWLWRQPALTLLSTTFPSREQHKNAIRTRASAVLSLRVAPGQTSDDIQRALEAVLLSAPIAGVRTSIVPRPGWGQSWLGTSQGPAFEAADRAYTKAWGVPLLPIGIGGSIPFVALFAKRYGDLPLILNGVLDPLSSAHGPDESLHLGIFEKAILANVHLLAELASTQGIVRKPSTT